MTTLFERAYDLGNMSMWSVQSIIGIDSFNPKDYLHRRDFVTYFGWSVPCKEAIEAIQSETRQPLFDVLAGTGYWAQILKQAGVNVIASDIHKSVNQNGYHKRSNTEAVLKARKHKIIRRNALKVAYHLRNGRLKGDLFMSWPPYEEPFAVDVLNLIPIGTRVVYIGEGSGGCTADAAFHKYLDLNFAELCCVQLPQFSGIHDIMTIYEKYGESKVDSRLRGVCFPRLSEEEEEEN